MKRCFKSVLACALALSMVVGGAACGKKKEKAEDMSALNGTYDITVWVSESEGVKGLTEQQIDKFEADHPGIVINATVEGVSEADSATLMITSVEDGADIFCFAQDQLARLVMAGALTKLGSETAKKVTELNDASAVAAATVGGELYCYPLTSDNGFFMFYDKSVVPEKDLDSFEAIIADCEKAGRMFSYELETSAWYNAGFFFATGCKSEWVTDETGAFTSVNDDFNSDKGVIALKGMQKLLKSKCYNSSSSGADFSAAVPSAVVITGTWAVDEIKKALGDNFGATDLPSFTVDGKSYHLGSFSGNKLLGVKPQVDKKKAAVLQQLALYLTGEECQVQRFQTKGWGPSNKAAQASDAVKNDVALTALAAQNEYARPQGQIHGSWWDIAKVYATAAKSATTDAELKKALQDYADSIDGVLHMSDEAKNSWSVIGDINGDGWSIDLPMTKNDDGSWTTNEAYSLNAGNQFKVRQGKNWDTAYPADNFVVEKTGTYYIKLNADFSVELVSK